VKGSIILPVYKNATYHCTYL